MLVFNYRLLFLHPTVLYNYPDATVSKSLMISPYGISAVAYLQFRKQAGTTQFSHCSSV